MKKLFCANVEDNKQRKNYWTKRNISRLVLLILILSILPPLFLGSYAHPSADDYYYGDLTYEAWNDTHSLPQVFRACYEQMIERYQNWQGNFIAIFIMGLMPAIFGEAYYAYTAYILILSFVIASYYFYSVFFKRVVGADRYEGRILASIFVFLSFQFTFVPSDAFYWFNGGSYYCFFYSLMLVLFGVYLSMITRKRKNNPALCLLCMLLAFIIGGGNYPTAFVTTLIMFFLTLLAAFKRDRRGIFSFLIGISSASSLLISMIAPGNAIRQASIGDNFGIIKTIVISFLYGGYTLAKSISLCVIVVVLALLPLLLGAVKKSRLDFSHPILVVSLSICFYCAQVTPVIYAQGYSIPYRLQNIIYFSYYVFLAIVVFYLCGYFERRYRLSETKLMQWIVASNKKERSILLLSFVVAFVFCIVGGIQVEEGENKKPSFQNLPISAEATLLIINGDARQYDEECKDRVEQLMKEEKIIRLRAFTTKPSLLFHSDIELNKKHWKNRYVARYYNKKYVILVEE